MRRWRHIGTTTYLNLWVGRADRARRRGHRLYKYCEYASAPAWLTTHRPKLSGGGQAYAKTGPGPATWASWAERGIRILGRAAQS